MVIFDAFECIFEVPGTLFSVFLRFFCANVKSWAEEQRSHGGVIFVDEKTISPADLGGLVRALELLAKEAGDWDWNDRVVFLRG